MPNIGPLELLVLLLLWVVASYLIARYAERKGHSFGGFLLLGLVLGPIVSGIVALLVGDRSQQASDDHLDQLRAITELRDAGTLSTAEFEAEKARILGDRPQP